MRRALILMVLALASPAAGQIRPLEQGGIIWFYYPDEKPSPYGSPTILHIGGLTRTLAKLGPGEFFGYPVAPGVHVFSYTRAPARNEALSVAIKPGEELYVEVHFRELTSVSADIGKRAIQRSRPLSELGVLDSSVIVVAAPASVKKPQPTLVASTVTDSRASRPVPPPALVVLPPQTETSPRTSPPAASQQNGSAPAMALLRPQIDVVSTPASPPLQVPATAPAPAAVAVSSPAKAAPPAAAPASTPQKAAAPPPPAPSALPPTNASRQFANASEAFLKATLNLQIDGRKREIDAVVTFDKDALVVTDKKDRGVLKLFPYASIKGAEYAYARSPRWKIPVPISLAFPPASARAMKHWFLVHSNEDYAVIELDKANYNLLLAAFELRTGKKVELVEDSN